MRILWVTNIKLPIIYAAQGKENQSNIGGWLDRISNGILENENNFLKVCYPFKVNEFGEKDNLSFSGMVFNTRKQRSGKLRKESYIESIKKIIVDFKPDIIHIHGTEFQHSWFFCEALKELGMIDKVIISIQGLVSVYAKHILLGLPVIERYKRTVREIILRNNIIDTKRNFERRGKYEELAIAEVKHIMGRTSWDKACTYRINHEAKYHFENETLRECFYTDRWDVNKCVKHRIFISQATYPVKGFHLFLEALKDIKNFYPDVTVHVAGNDLSAENIVKGSSYGLYVQNLLKKYDLVNCVNFCGSITAEEMKKEMMECNVFVSPSAIENSPNSVGEAMLLGVPVVSSDVGGVADMLTHKKEGFLYQSDAPYMLSHYVMSFFDNDDEAAAMGQAARVKASITHDYDKNLKELLEIYNFIGIEG